MQKKPKIKLTTLKPRLAVLDTSTARSLSNPEGAQRGNSTQRGYNYRWQQARARFLERNPLCLVCKAKGIVEGATVVDHVEPHRGSQERFWNEANWQPLCKPHHDEKTQRGE
jgi:5-methylcytosine-specific restriction protein A